MTMICERCGAEVKRKHNTQKFCTECSFAKDRDRYYQNIEKNREQHRRYYAKCKAEKEKRKVYVAGTGCTKWRSCAYGWPITREGHCRYHEVTGKCKIIEVNGRKTVAPTKNCVFYKRKKRDDAS